MAKMRERIKVIPEQSNQEEDKDLEVENNFLSTISSA